MFRFTRYFFIITNCILSFLLFTLIFSIRYMWIDFPGVEKRAIDLTTVLFFISYSVTIVILNSALKNYEINKIYSFNESIVFNILNSLFSLGFFGLLFYFTQIQFARFVFFSGFIAIPFILSFYNKLMFILLISKKKKLHFLYYGSKRNYSFFEDLIVEHKHIYNISAECILIEDSLQNLTEKIKTCDYLVIDSDQHFSLEQFQILNDYEISGGRVYSLIDIFGYFDQSLPSEIIMNNSHIDLFSAYKLDSLYNSYMKRICDILIALFLLIFLSPLILLTLLLVKLTSRGTVIYTQKRIGLEGKEFYMYKIRTMTMNAEKSGAQLTEKNDPRVTWIGRIIRPLRIDELPQLFNILKGQMSFIGPRPERREFIDRITKTYPLFKKRLLIKPGLTGWAQVKYTYVNQLEHMNKKLSYDLYYINNLSFLLDIKILLYTVETVLFRRGAV